MFLNSSPRPYTPTTVSDIMLCQTVRHQVSAHFIAKFHLTMTTMSRTMLYWSLHMLIKKKQFNLFCRLKSF